MTSIFSTNPTNQALKATTHRLRALSISSVCSDLSDGSKEVVINGQWRVIGKIGQGSFGEVFEVRDIYTGKAYAIKRENKSLRRPQLQNEYNYYNILKGGPGVPNCYWYGEKDDFNCLVLDLLGPSLKELRQCVKGFPLDIIVDLGCQMVDILRHVHDKGLVFRDMKPDNFLFSTSCQLPEVAMVKVDADLPHYEYQVPTCRNVFQQWEESRPKLYIVDFGLATYWRDPETGEPFPEGKRKTRNKIGTARYASLNVHHGRLHTRRDDLEGLVYMILDMVLGSLPWSGIQARNSKAGWDRMRSMKKDTFMNDLCADRPIGIVKFAEYTKHLRFEEEPDYELLKRYLRGSLPGGEWSKLTISPFGGGSTPKDTVGESKEKEPESGPAMQGNSSSSSEKIKWKDRNTEERIGWNTFKHDLEPWNPKVDWDRKSTSHTAVSWGDAQPNVSWGPSTEQGTAKTPHANDTVSINTIGTYQAGGWSQPQKETSNKGTIWTNKTGNVTSRPMLSANTSWKNTPVKTQQVQGANQEWQIVGQSRQRAHTGRRTKTQGVEHHDSWPKISKPKNEELWSSDDFGGGWVANAGGDGWVVRESRNAPVRSHQRTRRDPHK